jgi:hypothetical protein
VRRARGTACLASEMYSCKLVRGALPDHHSNATTWHLRIVFTNFNIASQLRYHHNSHRVAGWQGQRWRW